MRKKICLVLGVCSIVTTITFNGFRAKKEVGDLLMENIDALAAGGEVEGPVNCMGSGSVDCPHTKNKVKYVLTGYSFAIR